MAESQAEVELTRQRRCDRDHHCLGNPGALENISFIIIIFSPLCSLIWLGIFQIIPVQVERVRGLYFTFHNLCDLINSAIYSNLMKLADFAKV